MMNRVVDGTNHNDDVCLLRNKSIQDKQWRAYVSAADVCGWAGDGGDGGSGGWFQ